MNHLNLSDVPYFKEWIYVLLQRNEVLRVSTKQEFVMKKIFALLTALAFTAPLAANAQTFLTPHDQLVQKVQSTYHTNFENAGK
jgi:hypothetical protein